MKTTKRKITGSDKNFEIHETAVPFGGNFASGNSYLSLQNIFFS